MTTIEIILILCTAATGTLSIVVTLWLYSEKQREEERKQRRNARHEELKTMIAHVQDMTTAQHGRLSEVIGTKLDGLTRRLDEQSVTLHRHGQKIDHLDKAFGAMDKRVALVEAAKRDEDDKRRNAEKASG